MVALEGIMFSRERMTLRLPACGMHGFTLLCSSSAAPLHGGARPRLAGSGDDRPCMDPSQLL